MSDSKQDKSGPGNEPEANNAEDKSVEDKPVEEHKKRRIKSFVLRQGRTTEGQKLALATQWPKFGLTLESGLLDFPAIYGRSAPVILEIGFGNGRSLAEMAEAQPEQDYLGIEVHRPGVGALLMEVESKQLTNVRVFHHDAIEVLEQCIPDCSLFGVQLFFPDPWHKKRHNKRRIVQPQFAQFLAKKLTPGGYFHMATDWEDYAIHMMEVMSACSLYTNKFGEGHYAPRPDYRPLTKFELRGHRLGHGVWDLIFERN